MLNLIHLIVTILIYSFSLTLPFLIFVIDFAEIYRNPTTG